MTNGILYGLRHKETGEWACYMLGTTNVVPSPDKILHPLGRQDTTKDLFHPRIAIVSKACTEDPRWNRVEWRLWEWAEMPRPNCIQREVEDAVVS